MTTMRPLGSMTPVRPGFSDFKTDRLAGEGMRPQVLARDDVGHFEGQLGARRGGENLAAVDAHAVLIERAEVEGLDRRSVDGPHDPARADLAVGLLDQEQVLFVAEDAGPRNGTSFFCQRIVPRSGSSTINPLGVIRATWDACTEPTRPTGMTLCLVGKRLAVSISRFPSLRFTDLASS